MDKNTSRPASDAEWYCRRDPEEERFYEVQNQYLDEDKIIPCFESTGK